MLSWRIADDTPCWLAMGDFVRQIESGFDPLCGKPLQAGGIDPAPMPPLHRYLWQPGALDRDTLDTASQSATSLWHARLHSRSHRRNEVAHVRNSPPNGGICRAGGLRIGEIPTKLYPDKRDRPPYLRSFRDGWRHLRFIVTCPDHSHLLPEPSGLAWLTSSNGPTNILGHSSNPLQSSLSQRLSCNFGIPVRHARSLPAPPSLFPLLTFFSLRRD